MNVVTDTRIYVKLGSKYFGGQVEGLCGNYNGKSNDDFGAETSIASSLVDEASAWKTVSSCPEPSMQLSTEPCAVSFSKYETLVSNTRNIISLHIVHFVQGGFA